VSKAFVVLATSLDETQRTLIHEAIKSKAEDWWHELPDVWVVVGGESAEFWRDIVGMMTPIAPSGVLVLELAGEGWPEVKKGWASRMVKARTAWFNPPDPWATPGKELESSDPWGEPPF
jgi:hypothetical protein